jgi:pyrroloquinoline quinone biosynthesis protein D
MAALSDSSQPRLAAGCRLAGNAEDRTLLFPEGALRLKETSRAILERCDGQRTFAQIVAELQALYSSGEPAQIRHDVTDFLERMHQKRVVDF